MTKIYLKFIHNFIIISIPARSSSQATLDSLDMTRFSEDGGVDERVAVLEFELRKAKENINALRANLTVVAGIQFIFKIVYCVEHVI